MLKRIIMQTTVASTVANTTAKRTNIIVRILKAYTRLFNLLEDKPMTTRQILHLHHVGTALIFCMSATHTITLFLSIGWLVCAGILAKKGGAL